MIPAAKVSIYFLLSGQMAVTTSQQVKLLAGFEPATRQPYGTSYRAHHFGLQLLNLTSQHRFRSERCSEPTNADCVLLLLLLKDVFRDTDTMTIISPGFIPGGLLPPIGLLLYGLFNKLLYLQVIQYSTSMNCYVTERRSTYFDQNFSNSTSFYLYSSFSN